MVDWAVDCNLLTSIPHDAARGVYGSIDEVEADIRLIASNCKAYNAPGTIFHQAADQAGPNAILLCESFPFLDALVLTQNLVSPPRLEQFQKACLAILKSVRKSIVDKPTPTRRACMRFEIGYVWDGVVITSMD